MDSVEIWWTSLRITEKERIAGKVKKCTVNYPECTSVWNSLDDSTKQKIYEHCTSAHGLNMEDWKIGDPYGD